MVSVIIPTYNRENYVMRAVESVLNQTYHDVEVVLIDDGSTDNTAQKIQEIGRNDHRLKYFFQENKGVAAARNLGMQKSNGEYISFLDSDDVLEPDKIEEQLQELLKNQADVCVCNYWVVTGNKRRLGLRGSVKNFLLHYLQNKMTPQTNAWLFKSTLWKKNGILFREGCSWGEDMEFFVKLIYFTKKAISLDRPLFTYQQDTQGLSAASLAKLEQDVFIWNEIWKWLKSNIKDADEANLYERAIFGYRIPALLIYRLNRCKDEKSVVRGFVKQYRSYLSKRDWSNGLRSLKLAMEWNCLRLKLL